MTICYHVAEIPFLGHMITTQPSTSAEEAHEMYLEASETPVHHVMKFVLSNWYFQRSFKHIEAFMMWDEWVDELIHSLLTTAIRKCA